MIDLHVHTSRCGHADGTPAEYLDAAAAIGLTALAFCDHLPLPPSYPTGYAMPWEELPAYIEDVSRLASASAEAGGPEVLLGIEADWLPGHEKTVARAIEEHAFDIVLGSVHFIGQWAFDDPREREHYAEWPIDALWERYFNDLAAAAATGLFDVMAHPDLVKKFGYAPTADMRPWYEEVAAVFADAGVAVEVNTAGLRKPCAEAYPSLALLTACRKRGVPATIGSDAHTPGDVGAGLDAGRALLADAGYDSVLVFRGRKAEEVAL
jgi:histidinol-phosphatase (PHP family)